MESYLDARHAGDPRPRGPKWITRSGIAAGLFLAPSLLALVLFRLVPTGYALVLSFVGRDHFVAFANYAYLLNSPRFLGAMKTTVLFNVLVNPFQILISLALALLLTQEMFGSSLWRVIIFMPITVPLATSSLIWGVAFRPEDGPVNSILQALRLPPQPWITSPNEALISIIILASWAGCGYWMIFLIAGLRDIPDDFLEAARVDGANWWQTLFLVTLPMLRRPLTFVVVADTVANFLLFAPVQILTQGGPSGSTLLMMYEIYQESYIYRDFGLAYSEVVLLMIIVVVIVVFQFRFLRSND